MEAPYQAVIWDFGGVVTESPFEAFNRYEERRGLPRDLIRRINALNPDRNAWALLERNEIDRAAFDLRFAEEAHALGYDIPGSDVVALLSGSVRPRVLTAIDRCKVAGLRVGCITNNVPVVAGAESVSSPERAQALMEAFARFEVLLESSKVGVRKPDPRIYQMMCEALGVRPQRCVYLDDLGINCKPAAALGMAAIKVTGERQALEALSNVLQLDLS